MDFGDPAMMLDANSHQGPLVRLDPMKAAKRKRDEILPDSCDEDHDSVGFELNELKKLRIRTFTTTETVAQLRLSKGSIVGGDLRFGLTPLADLDDVIRASGSMLSIGKSEDPFVVYVTIFPNTSVEGRFVLKVPVRYPFLAPKVFLCDAMERRMQHPRLNNDGSLNLQILQGDTWTPCVGISNIIQELHQVMQGGQ